MQISHTYGRGFPFPTPVQSGKAVLENALRNARRYAYLTCQYFVGSEPLRDALRAALRTIDYADFPGKLLAFEALGTAGTPVSPEAYVHSKLLLVDDEVACVGTLNPQG